MRTKAREVVFQIVFASHYGGADSGLKNALYKKEKLTSDDIVYADKALAAVEENCAELSKLIDQRSVAFPESRLFPADRSIILVALAEIKYFPDIPKAVSVNEAANIASKYSSPKSASFVSGILSEVEKT